MAIQQTSVPRVGLLERLGLRKPSSVNSIPIPQSSGSGGAYDEAEKKSLEKLEKTTAKTLESFTAKLGALSESVGVLKVKVKHKIHAKETPKEVADKLKNPEARISRAEVFLLNAITYQRKANVDFGNFSASGEKSHIPKAVNNLRHVRVNVVRSQLRLKKASENLAAISGADVSELAGLAKKWAGANDSLRGEVEAIKNSIETVSAYIPEKTAKATAFPYADLIQKELDSAEADFQAYILKNQELPQNIKENVAVQFKWIMDALVEIRKTALSKTKYNADGRVLLSSAEADLITQRIDEIGTHRRSIVNLVGTRFEYVLYQHFSRALEILKKVFAIES